MSSNLPFDADACSASQDEIYAGDHDALCAHLRNVDQVSYLLTSSRLSDRDVASSMCSLAGLICVSAGLITLAKIELNSIALCPTILYPSQLCSQRRNVLLRVALLCVNAHIFSSVYQQLPCYVRLTIAPCSI